jgi:TFIIF-interacting CTD phosphatase-like protein
LDDIIIVDTNMHNYTLHLTNGIYLPPYTIDKDSSDKWLLMLGSYLKEFNKISNVREKIKRDFDLDRIFEENR